MTQAIAQQTQKYLDEAEKWSAHNYHPLPVVLTRGEGVWVYDTDDRRYMDMLSAYSALNQGHRHPKIVQALKDQADRITLTSRAFHNELFGPFCEALCRLAGMDMVLLMNSVSIAFRMYLRGKKKW